VRCGPEGGRNGQTIGWQREVKWGGRWSRCECHCPRVSMGDIRWGGNGGS
jgi:hypothetical protein